MREKGRHFIVSVAGSLFLLLSDQLTKYLAWRFLRISGPKVLVPGIFEFRYLENRGAAFGMLGGRQWLFILVASVISVFCLFLLYLLAGMGRHYRWLRICAMLLSAGAAGNMTDRLIHTYVIDFLYFSLINFPIFNFADVFVCISAAMFILLLFFYYSEEDLQKIRLRR